MATLQHLALLSLTFQRRVFGPGDKRASIGRNKTCRLDGQAIPPSLHLHSLYILAKIRSPRCLTVSSSQLMLT